MDLRSTRPAPTPEPSLEVHTFVESEQSQGATDSRDPDDSKAFLKLYAEFDLIASRLRQLKDVERSVLDLSHLEERTERAFRYNDAAILLRSRSSLPYLEEVLRDHSLPFRVVDGTDLKIQPHIRSVVALLRWLHRPTDLFSLAATLRSPLFGLSDESLFLLTDQFACLGTESWDENKVSALEPEQQTRTRQAHQVLLNLLSKALVLSPGQVAGRSSGCNWLRKCPCLP